MTRALASENAPIRILLVEDNQISHQLLKDYLTFYGYDVLVIPNGDEFFPSLQAFQPDLVLLDLKLPGTDGYTLLEQFHRHPKWRHLPIIVVSAFAFPKEQERARNLGARRYLVKPILFEALQRAIEEELQCVKL